MSFLEYELRYHNCFPKNTAIIQKAEFDNACGFLIKEWGHYWDNKIKDWEVDWKNHNLCEANDREDFKYAFMIPQLITPFIEDIDRLLKTTKAQETAKELIPIVSEFKVDKHTNEADILDWIEEYAEAFKTTHTKSELLTVFRLATGVSYYLGHYFNWEDVINRVKLVEKGTWGENLKERLLSLDE
eukprot:Gregarina_sp_Poly_1__5564@NODE_2939_length_1527_cov_56_945205_g1855_i0_p1_GENE_NODE_2939_length_1527_cov_56_945205_g1855_i0NODE_2939_length_1527_cov_56_945205_g1855_i0_p1_ORF_typecomplete_len186_score29_61_NODE_2939_length_1527_cov_56_945205_g1855_i0207764